MSAVALPAAIERLRKILNLEASRGYDNRAVAGGLAAFAPHWLRQAGPLSPGVGRVAALLREYNTLEPARRPAHLLEVQRVLGEILTPSPPPNPERGEACAERGTGEGRASIASGGDVPVPLVPSPRSSPNPARGGGAAASRRPRAARGEPATLTSPVSSLSGIKGANAAKLGKLGVFTVGDLLQLFPNRHVDYSDLKPIRELRVGEFATVAASVFSVDLPRLSRAGRFYVRATLADHTGTAIATWFNQRWIADQLQVGMRLYVSGKIGLFEGRPSFEAPEWEPMDGDEGVHTARIVPVYPLTADLKQRWLRQRMAEVVPRFAPQIREHLPEPLRRGEGLLPLGEAVRAMHFPRDGEELAAARERLAFDELFLIQVGVLQRRHRYRAERGIPIRAEPELVERFEAALPFRFTGAQRRALDDILSDMASGPPMTRLLQGDVGSGKTVVAAAAAFAAANADVQSALMAPTEILAEQHYRSLARLFGEAPDLPLLNGHLDGQPRLRIGLLTGSSSKAERARTLEAVRDGAIDLLIGTHALIEGGVEFANLGLAIVDEQHRFGVEQRASLRAKGARPHLLVMTATPIPRTLALTIYGDLDSSVIDELPPGRQPIRTRAVGPDQRHLAYGFVRKRVAEGEQAFVICPLVEESEKIEAKAATAEFDRLRIEELPDLAERMGLLHGRMRSREKDEVMARFRSGEYAILVSTAVVEVGVDVPNATVMLIEGADRFGLAQLHQFRGRVGRGQKPAYCVLISESNSAEARARLAAMERTANGFELAEEDLRLRGPGEFFGTRQSGLPDLRVASLADAPMLQRARRAAERLLAADPELRRPDHAAVAERVARFWRSDEQAG